ncbi:Hypothetical protein A7982_06108 [Minicystis rosea]|nr:Hypothetical protein A7982_06108 [Minicystis rosea]
MNSFPRLAPIGDSNAAMGLPSYFMNTSIERFPKSALPSASFDIECPEAQAESRSRAQGSSA